MSKLTKEFEHRGYGFTMSVELSTNLARRPDGRYVVTTSGMGFNNYSQIDIVTEDELKGCILNQENTARLFVDKKEVQEYRSVIELLDGLGFSWASNI